jgi:hypothetical protein
MASLDITVGPPDESLGPQGPPAAAPLFAALDRVICNIVPDGANRTVEQRPA